MIFEMTHPDPKHKPVVFAISEDRKLIKTWDDFSDFISELTPDKVHSQPWYVDSIAILIYAYLVDESSVIWKDTEEAHLVWDSLMFHLLCSEERIEAKQLILARNLMGGFWYA